MSKIATALALILLALGGPAGAVTLEATGGTIGLSDPPFAEPGVSLHGAGWSVDGFSGMSFVNALDPSAGFSFHASQLIIDGQLFAPPCCDHNSAISLAHPPILFDPYTRTQPLTRPFRMEGHLDLAGGVDIVGRGRLTITGECVGGGCSANFP